MLRSIIPEARRPTDHRHDRKGRGAERPIPVSIHQGAPWTHSGQRTQPLPSHERPFHHRSGSAGATTKHQGRQSHWSRRHCSQSHAGDCSRPGSCPHVPPSSRTQSTPSRYLRTGRRQMSSRYSRKSQSTLPPTTDPSLSPVSPAT